MPQRVKSTTTKATHLDVGVQISTEGRGVVAVRTLVGLAARVNSAHVRAHACLEHHLGADGTGDLHAVLLVEFHVALHVLCHLDTHCIAVTTHGHLIFWQSKLIQMFHID